MPTLSFDHHIGVMVSKTLNVLGFAQQNSFNLSSSSYLRIFYFSIIRSILEYGAVVSYSYLVRDQLRIERVLNRFISFATFISQIKYPEHE